MDKLVFFFFFLLLLRTAKPQPLQRIGNSVCIMTRGVIGLLRV